MISFVIYQAYAVEETKTISNEPTVHFVKVKTEPSILFLGGGGLHKEGSVITTDKAPEVWRDYKFVGWKVDGQ
ncbi:MAG: hypothetical protein ACRD9Q_11340, partial [Nitrososphaeraceae archaeon]